MLEAIVGAAISGVVIGLVYEVYVFIADRKWKNWKRPRHNGR